ncbi:MAG: GntR family transcriptional regulator [bacterium]|nr:GntR family transcriptional regulator [bacterium]
MSTKTEQVTLKLRQAIADEYRPGQALLPEREMEMRFQVSRATIRRALDALEKEGLVRRVRGSGTYVSDLRHFRKPLQLTSFSDDVAARGLVPSSRVLRHEVLDAPEELRLELAIGEEKVLEIERLRLADGEPLAHEVAVLPLLRFPGIELHDLSGSLYAVFEKEYKTIPIRARQRIRAIPTPRSLALLLGVPEGAAALEITRTTLDRFGSACEYVISTYRGDRYEFDVSVDR